MGIQKKVVELSILWTTVLRSWHTPSFLEPILRVAFILSIFQIQAQSQFSFRQLSVKEGLSQNSAISITQDSTGYLWIATQDGLNKYDGREFKVYPYNFLDITKPDYSALGKVYTDREGNIWIIPMDKVLRKYTPPKDSFEVVVPNLSISAIYQDKQLRIWIASEKGDLYLLKSDAETFLSEPIFSPPTESMVFCMAEDTKGNLVMTNEGHITKFAINESVIKTHIPKDSQGNSIQGNFSAFAIGPGGREWIATYGNGLYFKNREDEFYQRVSALSLIGQLPNQLNIIALYFDTKERLWVATYGNGLYMIDLKKRRIQHFMAEKYNPKAFQYNDVICIYEDYTGTLWFGTDGAGASYYDEYLEKFNALTNFETPEGIHVDVARALTVDHNNNIWIGTSGKGLTRYNPENGEWRTFTYGKEPYNLSSDRIMSLLTANNGSIWIGTQGGGLTILDTYEKTQHFSPSSKPPLPAQTIWCIFRDSKTNIWLGTREQGLILFDPKKGVMRHYTQNQNGLPNNNIRTITEDQNGNLWLGTENSGIVFFDVAKETFKTYEHTDEKNSLSNNNIKSLYFSPNEILWIGTNGGGLNAMDIQTGKFQNFTVNNGLANNVIYGILPDEEGNLWLSSNKGISKLTPSETLDVAPLIVNYNNYAGLATEFNTGAYFKDTRGILYFGGLDGFYWFKPKDIQDNKSLPKTTITGFEVLNEPHPLEENTVLTYDQNTLSFKFSSLQYSLPGKNNYKYRLLNHDNNWVNAGNTNFARYSKLDPGSYTFEVKSSNYDGVWNNRPERFSFTISPPFYASNLAKGIYILLFLLSLLLIYGYLKWRWRMQLNLHLKEEEANRLQKLNEFKSKLYTNIAHEFKTPLTLIAGPIDQKLSQGQLSDLERSNLSIVKRNTHRLTLLVDQLLELAKLEEGKLQLKVRKGNLSIFLKTIVRSFEHSAQTKSITFTMEIGQMDDAWFDDEIIEKILSNLLSNALKYTPKNGTCSIEAGEQDSLVYIDVKNTVTNPSGIELDKLFTRFYQQDEHNEGVGVGLSLVKELVRFYGGTVQVSMDRSQMIHFHVRLPVHPSKFPEKTLFEKIEVLNNIPEKEDSMLRDVSSEEFLKKGNPILLIVEDHNEVRTFIKSALQKKYHILEAPNGQVAQEIALSQIPDIILSDIRMPIMDGITLCNFLKNDERTSHIPIILLTANDGEEEELKGLTSGADDFVTKPFRINVLERRIANLIAIRQVLRQRYARELVLQPKDIPIAPADEAFLQKIQTILDEHLNDPEFNAVIFSEKAKMSRMQLHRKLQAYTGLSTTAFIRSQRMKQAVELLKSSELNVNEIAYSVGFNTPSYFLKCFKKQFHTTPSKYMASRSN